MRNQASRASACVRCSSITSSSPGNPGTEPGRVSSDPFVAKDARIALTAKYSRTTIRATAYDIGPHYLTGSVADETTIGGGLSASRQFAANSSGDLQVTYRDAETEAALDHNHIFQTEGRDPAFEPAHQPDDYDPVGGRLDQSETLAYQDWRVAPCTRSPP